MPANRTYGVSHDEPHLIHYWLVLVKRRKLIVSVFIVVVAVGIYVALSSTPLYRANATIKIEPQNPAVTGVSEMLPSQAGNGGPYDYYQTQYALLQSRALATTVIRELELASNEVFGQTLIVSSSPLHRINTKTFALVEAIAGYVSSRLMGPDEEKRALLPEDRGTEAFTEPPVGSGMIGRYLRFLEVNPIRNTRLVDVVFTTPSGELSRTLANAHATSFIRLQLRSRFELTNEARKYLETKGGELKTKLETSEAALNRFRRSHRVVSLEKGENIVLDRLVDLNRQLTVAQAQRLEAESLYRTVANKNAQFLSQIVREGLIPTLKAELARLEGEQTKLSTTFTPEHPRRLRLDRQIIEAREALNREISDVVRGIRDNYVAALAKERALHEEAERQQEKALNLKQVAVQYAVLEEAVKIDRALYESILKRLSETDISNDLAVSNIQVVELAQTPNKPSSPDTRKAILLSIFVGLFIACGWAFLLEYFDFTVNTPDHVWQVIGMGTLGVVPELNSLKRSFFTWRRATKTMLKGSRRGTHKLAHQSASKELILRESTDVPLVTVADCYRTIRTAFLCSQAEKPRQVVVVTSPSPGEGKTQTTLNLAIALAHDGYRILVVDADLRKGCCHKRLKTRNRIGLSNLLTVSVSHEEAIQATSVRGLCLLARGSRSPNPSDLLGSQKMRGLVDEWRKSFEFILVDTPPTIAVSDAAVLSRASDGVILVLHAQKTTSVSARRAIERLEAVRAPIIGVVLNGVDARNPSYIYYREYYGSDYCDDEADQEKDNPQGTMHGSSCDMTIKSPKSLNGEVWLAESAEGSVPPQFFDHLTSELVKAVGPMASRIIQDRIMMLGESMESFPKRRISELIDDICSEILNPQLETSFRQAIASEP